MDCCATANATPFAGKGLSAHPFLRVVLRPLNFTQRQGHALENAPYNRADAKTECHFKQSDLEEAKAHLILGKRPVCRFLILQIPHYQSRRDTADKNDLFKR